MQKAEVFFRLIKENFVNIAELDNKFSETLEPNALNSTIFISIFRMVRFLIMEEKLLEPTFFAKTNAILLKHINTYKDNNPKSAKVLEEFKMFLTSTNPLNNQTKPKAINSLNDPFYKTTLSQAFSYFVEGQSEAYEQAGVRLDELLLIESEQDMISFITFLEQNVNIGSEGFIKLLAFMIDIAVSDSTVCQDKSQFHNNLNASPSLDYSKIDALSRFFIMILRTVINIPKGELFERILQSILLIMTKNHDLQREKFNQRPFFRLFYNLVYDVRRKEFNFSQQEVHLFTCILMKCFDKIQPLKYPGFSFAWLDLVSNRNLMPIVLQSANKAESWSMYAGLLVDSFRFFKEGIETESYKSEAYKVLYKGMLKTLLVLLHDFPDFLIEASFVLIENVPKQFLQIKNVILSAYPMTMKVPDPFRITEPLELREEFRIIPNNLYSFEERIVSIKLHEEIIKFLSTKAPEVNEIYFRSICSKLLSRTSEVEVTINYPVVNSFVLFVPWMIYKNPDQQKVLEWKNDSFELFLKLLASSNPLMREALLNAILNQVRYPNLITFYFTSLIHYLFNHQYVEDSLVEQAFKMLFERLIVEVPRPWGLVCILCELFKDRDFFRRKLFKQNPEFMEMLKALMGKQNEESG